ncbi:hypothetical protein [Saccharopolyspora mangrovi]|uniref:Uncharacterized protein n=1 Tax=Saccharopolyspora mangrovi TaxID=3082379 RepID=A0ABU6A7L3_9PSEU|nr:hypothetical protein [Saccharopolyspora sp. S2-29]MEB3367379.1 hypothetical protein [Saccharopolyspora sp. S2-29]
MTTFDREAVEGLMHKQWAEMVRNVHTQVVQRERENHDTDGCPVCKEEPC